MAFLLFMLQNCMKSINNQLELPSLYEQFGCNRMFQVANFEVNGR